MSYSNIHEAAGRLPSELEKANLYVLDARAKFLSRRTNEDEEWPTGEHAPDGKVPAALSANLKFLLVRMFFVFFNALLTIVIETPEES